MKKPARAAAALFLLAYAAWAVLPVAWVAWSSLKPERAIFEHPLSLPSAGELRADNYVRAWREARFGQYFAHSAAVAAVSVALILALGSLAAYALGRFRFAGGPFLHRLFLAGLMIPAQLGVVPLFFGMRRLGLLDSLPGLVLVYVANGLPFAVFILAGFFRALPRALHDAAVIDGCGEFSAFWRVFLPLARPGLATVAIFQFVGIWKEYFYAFILAGGDPAGRARTLPLGLANLSLTAQYRSDYGALFAGLVLAALPILAVYLPLQKRIVKGVAAGAVKG